MADVAELKGPDCGNAAKESYKDTNVDNQDYVDEAIIQLNHMDYKFYYRVPSEELFKNSKYWAPESPTDHLFGWQSVILLYAFT